MNVVEHLAGIVSALSALQIPHLVMGGHAVRYYGFSRETTDHDLCIPPEVGQNLSELLSKTSLFVTAPLAEAPTWRGDDFRRFVIGRLPDGKEELLEFWLRNHLLDDFQSLYQRREEGVYGGVRVSFLSLPDLIRSKETERENDWQDISFLEEILDQRNLAAGTSGGNVASALSSLRSVRGLELAVSAGLLADQANAETALRAAENPITQAFLLPFAPRLETELPANEILPPPFRQRLKLVDPLSARHLALVEAVRLRYKRARQELDRKEKDEHRKKRETKL
jgi:hypothetical protein